MEINITEHQGCDLIEIVGRIDSYTTPTVKEMIKRLMEDGRYNFVLNLKDVTYLSSSGILMFVNTQRKITKRNEGKIVFTEVPELIFSNIKLAGFDQLFEFTSDTQSALSRF